MLEANALKRCFGDATAVDDITFTVPKATVAALLGVNGAGKTTTIRMLTTYLTPTSGTARVGGFDIREEAAQVRQQIGYLPELPALYPELTVEEHLKFHAGIRSLRGDLRDARIFAVLERCALGEVRNKVCRTLSRGLKQRLSLAIATLHDPQVLILDEPTSGLDPKQIHEMRKFIQDLGATKTVLLSTHLLAEVSEICSKVIILSEGRVTLESDVKTIGDTRALEKAFLESVAGRSAEAIQQKVKVAQG